MAEPAAAHSVATSDQPTVTEATRAVATLNAQVDSVRAELARVTRDVAEAQRDFSEKRAAQLVEANEQLVLSALQAEAVAETAIGNLGEVTRASQRDGLTDTPNRALMLDRLEGAIALARRRGTHIAVLFLDLDDFKQINDMHGHAIGDAVLQLVARRLESVVRNSDTVSRHGGDEFLVLLAEIAHASDAAAIAEKMLAAVAAPCGVGTLALQLWASVGITIYPDDDEDAASLISRADAAMYRSKYRQPGTYTFHSEIASERGREPSVPGARQQPGASSRARPADDASRANEVRSNDLQEANEQLVIAAVASQEL